MNEPTSMTQQERAVPAPAWRRGSSEELMEQTRAHNPDELVQLYSAEVWRFTSSLVSRPEDAEDVVMEVFAAAFANMGRLERASDQRLWLLGVARKKVSDSLRRQYRRSERPFAESDQSVAAPEPTEFQLATRGALEGLPDNQRQALTLKYVNGLSTEEVGAVMRKTLAATNSLLQRGRESMREALRRAMTEGLGDLR